MVITVVLHNSQMPILYIYDFLGFHMYADNTVLYIAVQYFESIAAFFDKSLTLNVNTMGLFVL